MDNTVAKPLGGVEVADAFAGEGSGEPLHAPEAADAFELGEVTLESGPGPFAVVPQGLDARDLDEPLAGHGEVVLSVEGVPAPADREDEPEDERVGMPHVLRAAHAEASTRERPITEAEIRGWA